MLAKATLEALDLDGDFDPVEYDKQMKAIYENEQYFDDGEVSLNEEMAVEASLIAFFV